MTPSQHTANTTFYDKDFIATVRQCGSVMVWAGLDTLFFQGLGTVPQKIEFLHNDVTD